MIRTTPALKAKLADSSHSRHHFMVIYLFHKQINKHTVVSSLFERISSTKSHSKAVFEFPGSIIGTIVHLEF
jgi:hypothetical protein